MSRNKGRTGGKSKPDNTGAPVQHMTAPENTEDAPAFSFVVPTAFVDLPSKGRFYPEGHPLHEQDTLEIREMTAKEEDILTSRTLLKKGIALDRVIKRLIAIRALTPKLSSWAIRTRS